MRNVDNQCLITSKYFFSTKIDCYNEITVLESNGDVLRFTTMFHRDIIHKKFSQVKCEIFIISA